MKILPTRRRSSRRRWCTPRRPPPPCRRRRPSGEPPAGRSRKAFRRCRGCRPVQIPRKGSGHPPFSPGGRSHLPVLPERPQSRRSEPWCHPAPAHSRWRRTPRSPGRSGLSRHPPPAAGGHSPPRIPPFPPWRCEYNRYTRSGTGRRPGAPAPKTAPRRVPTVCPPGRSRPVGRFLPQAQALAARRRPTATE